MKAVALLGLGCCLLAAPALAARGPNGACAAFMRDFSTGAAPLRASFERPLTITRGFGAAEEGVDVYILSTNAEVEGTLKCRADNFLRFELRVPTTSKDKALQTFEQFQRTALIALMHWEGSKAETVVHAMGVDAAEYLRASEQRGDLYIAGKVEYHQGDAFDLGVMWTHSDRLFVISAQSS